MKLQMLFRITVLAAMLISLVACTEQMPKGFKKIRTKELPNGFKVHEYKMDNGLEVLLVPNHQAPVFSFQAWIKAGAAHEKMDPKLKRTGLAHLFEHMMFRGTKKNGPGVFDRTMSESGAVGLNATTSMDRTNYFENLTIDYLDDTFRLEADRMENLILNEKLFKTEMGAVLGELKLSLDRPGTALWYKTSELAYGKDHPYGYRVIGFKKVLEKFTAAEGKYFYEKYYAPNNATLIISGDFQLSNVLNIIKKYYAHMKPKQIPDLKPEVLPLQEKGRQAAITHPAAANQELGLAFVIPPSSEEKDIAALEVLSSVLAYGNGSLLEQSLVDGGLASSMSAGAYTRKFQGIFNINASIAKGVKVDQIIVEIDKAIKAVMDNKLSEKDLRRAKNQILLNWYNDFSSNAGIGKVLGYGMMVTGDFMHYFNVLKKIKKVDRNDLARVAKKYLNKSQSNLVILSPEKK